MFKHPLEQQFSTLSNNMNAIENIGSLSPENICDFEFISNYQAIQNGVRNTFGYLNSRNSPNTSSATQTITQNSIQNVPGQLSGSMGGCNAAVGGPTSKQPPISRPTSITASSGFNCPNESSQGSNESGLILSSLIGNVSNSGNSSSDHSGSLTNGWAQGLANLTTLSSNNPGTASSMLNGAQQNHSHQNLETEWSPHGVHVVRPSISICLPSSKVGSLYLGVPTALRWWRGTNWVCPAGWLNGWVAGSLLMVVAVAVMPCCIVGGKHDTITLDPVSQTRKKVLFLSLSSFPRSLPLSWVVV